MFVNNEIKKQLEKLSNEEDNKKCFDCESEPARWTSLNNGIYLCHECSEEHKNIESGINIVKSITLEQWNKNQLNLMKIGGNKRLKKFLEDNNVPKNIDKKTLYNSKLMVYYRKLLKSEAEGELLLEQIPSKEELWESYLENSNNNSNNNNLNFNMNFNTNINEDDNNLNINNQNNNNIVYYDNDTNNQFVNGHLIDYPQSSIKIDEDQYIIAKEKKILEEKLENSVLKKDSLLTVNDDPKYSSVGSENENNNNASSFFQNSGYFGTIGNIVNTMKEKINEYQIGKGILYIGGKVFEGVIFIGGKIIEKGSDIIHSETTQNIVNKAGEGLKYIANKIAGNSNNNENSSSNNYMDISDDNNTNNKKERITNFNTSSDYENNYGILNDQNENLLV